MSLKRGSQAQSGARSGPAYRRIAEDLKRRISGGEFKAGGALPSLRELAREYRTGVFTVRSVMDLLRSEGQVRLARHRRAVVLDAGKTPGRLENLVALVNTSKLARLHDSFYSTRVLRGVADALDESNGSLLTLSQRHFKNHLPSEILNLPLRGALLFGGFPKRTLHRYEKVPMPVVLVDRPGEGLNLHSVAVDNVAAGTEAARRLLALGHTRIAYLRYLHILTGEPDPDDDEREGAIRRALNEARLGRNALRTFNTWGDDGIQRQELRNMLLESPRSTAVVVGGWERAMRIEEVANDAGLGVPGDLSIACIAQDSKQAAKYSGPRIDFEEMGRRAVRLLNEPRTPALQQRIAVGWNQGKTLAKAT